GAVVASCLPPLFTWLGISNHGTDAAGHAVVPDTLYYSFDLGAIVLFTAVAWTVLRTREYPPETLHAFVDATPEQHEEKAAEAGGGKQVAAGLAWSAIGLAAIAIVAVKGLDRQLYLVSGMSLAWGLALLAHAWFPRPGFFGTIMRDLEHMPLTMRRLI